MLEKHSVNILGHKTSFSLEPEFWNELKNIANLKKQSISSLITEIDSQRTNNLSSAIRVYVLKYYIEREK